MKYHISYFEQLQDYHVPKFSKTVQSMTEWQTESVTGPDLERLVPLKTGGLDWYIYSYYSVFN